jgi:uncharacterized protein YecE (DUF72 family)
LPPGHRYAFEFRDPSWWRDDVYALLAEKAASFVSFDLAGLRSPRRATGSLVYVRLHGHEQRYRDRYPEAVLADWAAWLIVQQTAGRETLVYLDNTMLADHALRDAQVLAAMAGAAGAAGSA